MLTIMDNDPSLPYPATVDHCLPHNAGCDNNADAWLRESCWSSLDDDFCLMTEALLDDGPAGPLLLGNDTSSKEMGGTEEAFSRAALSRTEVANENTVVEPCPITQFQSIIASIFGQHYQLQNQPIALFPPPPLALAQGTIPNAPHTCSNHPSNSAATIAAAPACYVQNPVPAQQQQQTTPYVAMPAMNKRLRVEAPFVALPESQGTILQDPIIMGSDSTVTKGEEMKTPNQMSRRRERNRLHARQTRLRNKTAMETLRKELMDLQRENAVLKAMARSHLDESQSKTLLEDCNAMENLPVATAAACGANILQQVVAHVKMLKSQNCLGVTDVIQQQTSSSTADAPNNSYFTMIG